MNVNIKTNSSMKKTLLAVALLFGSVSVFAQSNNFDNIATKDQVAVSKESVKILTHGKKTLKSLKGNPEGTELICDFSDQSLFRFGYAEGHNASGQRGGWQYHPDTNDLLPGTAPGQYSLNKFLGLEENWDLLSSEDYANMSVGNGFAFVDWLALWQVDKAQNADFNAYVLCTTPIVTFGKTGVDLYISQMGRKFNYDQYFIEWSYDSAFAEGTYDSLEYNTSVEYDGNTTFFGVKKVNIPVGTPNCNIISSDENKPVYIRIRVYCPGENNGEQPHGYFYFIDDIAWAEAPAARIEILDAQWITGYSQIPSVVTPDNLNMQLYTENTGRDTLVNIVLRNDMYSFTDFSDESTYEYVGSNYSDGKIIRYMNGKEWQEDEFTPDMYPDSVFASNGTLESVTLSRSAYIVADSVPQLKDKGEGYYAIKSILSYKSKAEDAEQDAVNVFVSANMYDVTAADAKGNYTWARDMGVSSSPFKYGHVMVGSRRYVTEDADAYTQGYSVCLSYTATAYDGDVYAKGVEIVSAPDTSKACAKIRGYLMRFNDEAEAAADAVYAAMVNDNPVQSNIYTVEEKDLNTINEETGYMGRADQNKIYLPFTNTYKLEANQVYYACYKLVANAQFAVARDMLVENRYGTGLQWDMLINTPNISDMYSFGFPMGRVSNRRAPFIRLVVSKDATADATDDGQKDPQDSIGLNGINTLDANMMIYPNPVADNLNLTYSLNNGGNVIITVSDLMGRTLITKEAGMQTAGKSYTANIDVRDLANGSYLCTVSVNGVKSTSKFVVNK